MGQSREAKRTNQMLDREYGNTERQFGDFYNSRNRFADEARGRSNQAYDTAYRGYQSLFDNPRGGSNSSNEALGYYRDFAKTGGLTDENVRRIRGNGVFDEFSRTGGLSDQDIANMRLHGSAVIPGFYDAIRRNLQRSTNVTGYNPGYNAQIAASSRDQAREAQNAALETELGIVDTRNKGRMWGTEGLSGAERSLVDATQRGRMFGIEGLDRDYNTGQDRDAQTRLAAIGGIRGLRTDTPGEVGMYEDELFNSLTGGAGARRGLIQDRMQYNPNRSFLERMAPLINAGVGVATGFAGGGGGGGSFADFFRRRSPSGGYNFTPGTSSAGPGYYGAF